MIRIDNHIYNLLEAADFSPTLSLENSAWIGHIPFAAWLTRTFEPKIFVELGTHWGHSYFAFCQAVDQNSHLPTKCYAIDTWKGDEHAGYYVDEVFDHVNTHNQEHYASFSYLLRMTFDEAVNYFSDGSIDLLHIDGLHTYEAARHDFETWLPKLAPGAVVLFHDINVRERGFGVWKYWEELKCKFPNHIEFFHSYGLGVLRLDTPPDSRKLEWLEIDAKEQQYLKNYFAALGQKQFEHFELKQEKIQVKDLKQSIKSNELQIVQLKELLQSRDSDLIKLKDLLLKRDEEILGFNSLLHNLDLEKTEIKKSLQIRDSKLTDLNEFLKNSEREIEEIKKLSLDKDVLIANLNQSLLRKEEHIGDIYSSTSWRVSTPVRLLKTLLLKLSFGLNILKLAIAHTGGMAGALSKTQHILKTEGYQGIRVRTRFLSTKIPGTEIQELSLTNFTTDISDHQHKKIVRIHTELVDIVVCVHNALQDVQKCLESILRNTIPPYHLIIVDDGSQQETRDYLKYFSDTQPITLIRNDIAQGYTKAANQGMRAANGEHVILLNSDTVVTPRWLERLVECANSDERIGLVGPLSNTASWQSIPNIFNSMGDWADNPLPSGWSVEQFANEVARMSPRIYPRVGFLNGFCLLVKRGLIQDIGYFDELAFGRGYGEENDYCLRATNSSWQLVIADDCYVFHAQSKSYSTERRFELSKLADEALAKKHNQFHIGLNLAMTQGHPVLRYTRKRCENIEKSFYLREEASARFEGKRVLFLLPARTSGGGGNVVLLEAAYMRQLGVDVWIANLEINRHLFEQYHPDITIPTLFLTSPEQLTDIAGEFDAIIATLYITVYWMSPLTKLANCPVLGYYVQDFEPDFFPEGSPEYRLAFASYTEVADMKLFSKTQWTARMLERKLGSQATTIGPSLDCDLYYPSSWGSNADGKIRISAMVRPSTPRRAPEMTMLILKRLAKRFGDRIEISIFGVQADEPQYLAYDRGFSHTCLGELTSIGVANLLSKTDIFLDCSLFQAMGLTAMEAMASGATVIGPINGGLSEIITHGQSGLLVDTTNEAAIWEAACQLIEDANALANMRNNVFDVLLYSPLESVCKILECLFGDSRTNIENNQILIEELM